MDYSVFFEVIADQACFIEFSEAFAIEVSKYSGEVSVFVLFSGFNAIVVTKEIKK